MNPISTSFAPNEQRDDVLLSIQLLSEIVSNKHIDQDTHRHTIGIFKRDFLAALGLNTKTAYSFTFSSARSGLYYSLLSLNLPKQSEVILQAFTCVAVPASIKWAGLTPVFADVNTATYNLDIDDVRKKITDKTRAIIVQHTFGIPGPIAELKEIAKKHNLRIIEDCAHVIGTTYENKAIGTIGDIGIFSFGRDKVISSTFGGLVVTKDKEIADSLASFEASLNEPPKGFVIRQLLYPIIYAVSLPVYNLFVGKLILWLSAKAGLLSKAVLKSEGRGEQPYFLGYSFSPYLCRLVHHKLSKLDSYNKHRRDIASLYIKALNLPLGKDVVYARVPIEVSNKDEFLKEAVERGLHLDSWYRSPVDPPSSNPKTFNYTSSPQAERIAKHVVNLPTHINTSKDDAKRVIEFVLEKR